MHQLTTHANASTPSTVCVDASCGGVAGNISLDGVGNLAWTPFTARQVRCQNPGCLCRPCSASVLREDVVRVTHDEGEPVTPMHGQLCFLSDMASSPALSCPTHPANEGHHSITPCAALHD